MQHEPLPARTYYNTNTERGCRHVPILGSVKFKTKHYNIFKMKLKLLLLFLMPFSLFGQEKDNFSITSNKNIETYFLAEILSADFRTTNKDFEQYKVKESQKYQPIVKQALASFERLKTHKIIQLTAAINDTLLIKYGLGNDNMMNPLLYHKEFPSTAWQTDYQYKNSSKSDKENEEITLLYKNYINELAKFYNELHLDTFFIKNQYFYNGAIAEFNKHIPNGFVKGLEHFYGEKKLSYTVLVSPMMMWPIEDNEGRGIGANVVTKKGMKIFEIASPYVRAYNEEQFGYDNEFMARFLTIHEFGHSFVNNEVYKYSNRINKTDTLFEKSILKERMKSYGIPNWEVYIIENLIRTGEIQVAIYQNDDKRAKQLREYHLKNNFIFIPLLEEKLKAYNANRNIYRTFEQFLPTLLTVFENASVDFINEELNK